jgi:hypothetical protein
LNFAKKTGTFFAEIFFNKRKRSIFFFIIKLTKIENPRAVVVDNFLPFWFGIREAILYFCAA